VRGFALTLQLLNATVNPLMLDFCWIILELRSSQIFACGEHELAIGRQASQKKIAGHSSSTLNPKLNFTKAHPEIPTGIIHTDNIESDAVHL
jgi:hypothetical protein